MTKLNTLELAKQGNPKAIATLISGGLQPKGITVKVAVKDSCLYIILESAEIPEQKTLMPMIRKGIMGLEVEGVEQVKVYGRCIGETSPAWSKGFKKNIDINNTTQIQKINTGSQTTVTQNTQTFNESRRPKIVKFAFLASKTLHHCR
ncbi:MAG: hypothetical protein F6K41_35505 [Symploca sp. SIO3E6]|nr:hypothetical protein [Caldora sp. SIO3E6]